MYAAPTSCQQHLKSAAGMALSSYRSRNTAIWLSQRGTASHMGPGITVGLSRETVCPRLGVEPHVNWSFSFKRGTGGQGASSRWRAANCPRRHFFSSSSSSGQCYTMGRMLCPSPRPSDSLHVNQRWAPACSYHLCSARHADLMSPVRQN